MEIKEFFEKDENVKFLSDLLQKTGGVLTAEGQEDILKKFGSELSEELTKKWEEKFGSIEDLMNQFDKNNAHKETHGFKGLGDFAKSVKNYRTEDARLKTLTTDTQGEYIIPETFVNSILATTLETNPLMQMARQLPLSGNSASIPFMKDKDHTSLYGGIVLYWVDEAGTVTDSNMKFGKMNLRLHDLMGLIPVTNDMLEDAPMAVDMLVRDAFADALNFELEKVFLRGSGAGQPLGVLNSAAVITQTKKTSQAADTIVSENLAGMYSHLPNGSKRNAIWLYDASVYQSLVNCKLGESDYPAFIPAGGARNNQSVDTLWGRPAYESEQLNASLGDLNDLVLIDPTQYIVATKGSLAGKFDSSMHLYFDYNKTAYRIVFRVDGQPTWETYITPATGSHYKSPYINLEART